MENKVGSKQFAVRIRPHLVRIAAVRCPPSEVDDVVADTLAAAAQAGRLSTADDARWCAAVCCNIARERGRSARRERLATVPIERVDPPAPEPDGDDPDQLRARLLRAVCAAPLTRMQTLCVAGQWLGSTPEHMAATFGLSPATIRSHLSQARHRLRQTAR